MTQALAQWPIIELLVAVAAFIFYRFFVWRRPSPEEADSSKRELGANVIVGQLTGVITAGTVIFGLLGAFTVLVLEQNITDHVLKLHLHYAILWSLLSLGVAVYYLSVVPGYVTRYNVANKRSIAIGAMLSLLFFLFALVRFWWALRYLLA